MNEADMDAVAAMIASVAFNGEAAVESVRAQALELLSKYPLYEG